MITKERREEEKFLPYKNFNYPKTPTLKPP